LTCLSPAGATFAIMLGMTETLLYSDPTTLAKAVGELIQQDLADGVHRSASTVVPAIELPKLAAVLVRARIRFRRSHSGFCDCGPAGAFTRPPVGLSKRNLSPWKPPGMRSGHHAWVFVRCEGPAWFARQRE
jgi:hypothetical protein